MDAPAAQLLAPADSVSFNTDNLFADAPPGTATRLRQDIQLHVQGGTVNTQAGPSHDFSSESDANNEQVLSSLVKFGNSAEVIRLNRTLLEFGDFLSSKGLSMNDFSCYQQQLHGRNIDDNGFVIPSNLENMSSKFNVSNGILKTANVSHNNAGASLSGEQISTPLLTWKNIVENSGSPNSAPNSANMRAGFGNIEPVVVVNDDGSSTISLPRSFLEKSRTRWATSCIGHFVGGSFAFKYVKNQAMKLWMNKGLMEVFYSSKGYYTFQFGTLDEMKAVLALNSVTMGGKRLYLAPWTDGSSFKRNVIPSISTWVRLTEVPHSYWSWECLGSIVKAFGKPLDLDKQTALLKPMKYAGVLVELKYGTAYPKEIWVPTINEADNSIIKVKVGVEYSAMPPSCKFCQAFGHSDFSCAKNPNCNQKNPVGTSKKGTTWCGVRTTFAGCDVEKDEDLPMANLATTKEPSVATEVAKDSVPAISSVEPMPVPEIIADSANKKENEHCNEDSDSDMQNGSDARCDGGSDTPNDSDDDSLAETDDIGIGESVGQCVVFGLAAQNSTPLVSSNQIEEGEINSVSPGGMKKRRNRLSKSKAQNGPWVGSPQQSRPVAPSPSKKRPIVDKDGFTKVISKRGLRSQGNVTKKPSFK